MMDAVEHAVADAGQREDVDRAHGDDQNHEAEPPGWNSVADDGCDPERLIKDAAAPQRGDDSDRDAQQAEKQGRPSELDRIGKPVEDLVHRRLLIRKGATEVQMCDLPEPFDVLDGDGLVESEGVALLSREAGRQPRILGEGFRTTRRQVQNDERDQRHAQEQERTTGSRDG